MYLQHHLCGCASIACGLCCSWARGDRHRSPQHCLSCRQHCRQQSYPDAAHLAEGLLRGVCHRPAGCVGLLIDLNPHELGTGSVVSQVLMCKLLQGMAQQALQPHLWPGVSGGRAMRHGKVDEKVGWRQDQIHEMQAKVCRQDCA